MNNFTEGEKFITFNFLIIGYIYLILHTHYAIVGDIIFWSLNIFILTYNLFFHFLTREKHLFNKKTIKSFIKEPSSLNNLISLSEKFSKRSHFLRTTKLLISVGLILFLLSNNYFYLCVLILFNELFSYHLMKDSFYKFLLLDKVKQHTLKLKYSSKK